MTDKKLLLRASLKLLSGFAIVWLGYIFLAGFFISPDKPISAQSFDTSFIREGQATYYFVNGRELLVFKKQNKTLAFWAQDPIYGCRLEFLSDMIKPVCIDIRYTLNGFSKNKNQWLSAPDYELSLDGTLHVY